MLVERLRAHAARHHRDVRVGRHGDRDRLVITGRKRRADGDALTAQQPPGYEAFSTVAPERTPAGELITIAAPPWNFECSA